MYEFQVSEVSNPDEGFLGNVEVHALQGVVSQSLPVTISNTQTSYLIGIPTKRKTNISQIKGREGGWREGYARNANL